MQSELRITPEEITTLSRYEIFVFGSNLKGFHGAGAAKLAYDNGWAKLNIGHGLIFSDDTVIGSYAIPTKGLYIETLPLEWIEYYIKHFIDESRGWKTQLNFLVTQIGCGLAGYTPKEIAPLFKPCLDMENVWLPQSFISVIG